MSYESFVDNLVSQLKIKVTEGLSSYVNNKCNASVTSTQSKLLRILDTTSHFVDGYKYDPNIPCDPDKFDSEDVCNKYKGLFCDDKTRKCVPMCNISSKQNQNVDVKVNCIGQQQSFINTSSTKEVNLSKTTPVTLTGNISDNNNVLQSTINKSLQQILGNDVSPNVLQKINNVLVENSSSSYVSQTCSSNIVSIQNQYIVVQGDIYCTPDSVININQETNIINYVNCIFSNAKSKLMGNQEISDLYNKSKNSDCICDRIVTSECDRTTNMHNVSYNIIKPATGNGKCDCPVNVNKEPCNFTFSKAVCIPDVWSEWSECKDGYQNRTRNIRIGIPDCINTSQKRICGLNFGIIQESIKEQVEKYKIYLLGVFGLIILLLCIWIFR